MSQQLAEQVWAKAAKIRLLLLDVDGVLTDGRIIMDHQGRESKAFNVRDGFGIRLLLQKGIEVALVTGRNSPVVQKRAEDLGIKRVKQGLRDKLEAYQEIAQDIGIEDEEACFMGDDVVDIPLLKRVGLPIVVSDAEEETKRFALYITTSPGGRGAVREVCALILQAQGIWAEIMRRY